MKKKDVKQGVLVRTSDLDFLIFVAAVYAVVFVSQRVSNQEKANEWADEELYTDGLKVRCPFVCAQKERKRCMNTFNAQFRVQLTIEKGNMPRPRKVNLTIIIGGYLMCSGAV